MDSIFNLTKVIVSARPRKDRALTIFNANARMKKAS